MPGSARQRDIPCRWLMVAGTGLLAAVASSSCSSSESAKTTLPRGARTVSERSGSLEAKLQQADVRLSRLKERVRSLSAQWSVKWRLDKRPPDLAQSGFFVLKDPLPRGGKDSLKDRTIKNRSSLVFSRAVSSPPAKGDRGATSIIIRRRSDNRLVFFLRLTGQFRLLGWFDRPPVLLTGLVDERRPDASLQRLIAIDVLGRRLIPLGSSGAFTGGSVGPRGRHAFLVGRVSYQWIDLHNNRSYSAPIVTQMKLPTRVSSLRFTWTSPRAVRLFVRGTPRAPAHRALFKLQPKRFDHSYEGSGASSM